jgi:hypothetical protein
MTTTKVINAPIRTFMESSTKMQCEKNVPRPVDASNDS